MAGSREVADARLNAFTDWSVPAQASTGLDARALAAYLKALD